MADEIRPTITQLAQQAAAPERKEAGPGDVGPTVNQTPQQKQGLVTLPFTPEDLEAWFKRIDASDARIKAHMDIADILLDEYMPVVKATGTPEAVKSNGHFRNVHSKLGQLFYRSPDVILEPDDPGPASNTMPNPMDPAGPPLKMEDIIAVKSAVLRKKMGRDGIKGGRLMDELLFDVLAWAGIGCAKVGYKAAIKQIQRPQMVPAPPTPNPGDVLGLSQPVQAPQMVPATDAMGQPVMETVPVTVFRSWYARRFSPKKLITNADLYSTRFEEDSTFLGMHFYMSPQMAMKAFGLTEDEASKVAKDDKRHEYKDAAQTGDEGLVHGMELWVKLPYFTDEVHPQAIGQLVLIEGIKDRPIVWRPSPDQQFDPNTGQLTPDSLDTLPIKILTIRDIADACFPLADSAFTNSGIKELGTWRRQSVKLRDVNIGKFLVGSTTFDDVELEALRNAEAGEIITVDEAVLANGIEKVIGMTPQIKAGPDDPRSQELMKREVDETLGISANQAGVPEDTVRSATETAAVSQAIAARNEKERGRVVDFWLDIVRAVDQLLMRYATQDEYVQIGGDEGARRMQVWNNKIISGKYLYDIAPDSQLAVDTAKDFTQLLNLYNLAAGDPLFNRTYVLRRLARMRGLDPLRVVLDPAQVQAQSQPPHGGPGATVNQHTASNSGGMPNAPGADNHRATQVK
jgi:hypothetical protein